MKSKKYIIPIIILLLTGLGAWLFYKVLLYLVISLVLFLIGFPLTSRIERVKIGGKKINDGIASVITLLVILGVLTSFFIMILPPLIEQVSFMSTLNFYDVLHDILDQYPSLKTMLNKLGSESALKLAVNEHFSSAFNFGNVSSVINNLFDYLAAFLGGLFCVLFITFFLLKDENTVNKTLLLITPQNFETQMTDILRTSKKMLSKYFTGLLIDIIIVGSLAGICLWLFGIKNALIIGVMAGLFNLIPYLGPIITLCFALFLGVSGCIEAGQYILISSTITKITIVLLSINLFDAIFLQPYIFSNTVKAHPLEIFLVILMAGTLAGIGGMVVAIPVYTLIRITAKEFLVQFKFFKKLTENIPE